MDGVLDAWDLLQQHNEPVLSIKVCDEPLFCMRPHESGRFISTGSENGATYLIEVSDNMTVSLKNDKPLLTAMFERENKREKILEAKLREIKLKVKTAQLVHEDNEEAKIAKVSAIKLACAQAEQDYFKAVEKEKAKQFPKLYKHKKRKSKVRSDDTAEGKTENDDANDSGPEGSDDEYEEDEDRSLLSE